MISFAKFGNDLYTGKRSIAFVGKRRTWYLMSAVVLAIAVLGLGVRHLNLGLEFTGGSEFRVAASSAESYETKARAALDSVEQGQSANITRLGSTSSSIRVQTEKLDDRQSDQVRAALAEEFDVPADRVSASFIGPSWGASVSQQALRALGIFLVLVFLCMALYFRTWKMSAAAMVALVHDMVITVGIYALSGFEVSPATMIGFLTVLGYSLYDTVVVFDKVRENTTEAIASQRMTYAQAANLAVNQTVVRSINTTVVALLPIAAVLVMGFTVIGPGTLLDLSLVLFIGMAAGAYSSIFIATPLLVSMRSTEPAIQKLEKAALRYQQRNGMATSSDVAPHVAIDPAAADDSGDKADNADMADNAAGADGEVVSSSQNGVRGTHRYASTGPRNQPKRPPRSRR